ncbi:MAG: RluA family pseudouridine synthase [Proteobacteria bacterium]|nr:RluA family pseudouridine synthase [Pseudomonadota bacterium]
MTDNDIDSSLKILYADSHLIVVYKPARIPVASEDSGDLTLLEQVREWNKSRQSEGKKGYCVPIHFLDRPVSGAVIFAISSKAASRLNEQFRNHKVKKTYIAISANKSPVLEGSVVDYLTKDNRLNMTRVCSQEESGAKRCELSYNLIASDQGMNLYKVNPVTGRSHQIRVQFSNFGCPLYGDVKYGSTSSWDKRIALHAFRIEFTHPVTKEPMTINCDPPNYWDDIWKIKSTFQNI